MIIKSYEIAKKSLISKFNFFLFYGENIGLKIDLKNLLKKEFAKRYCHERRNGLLYNMESPIMKAVYAKN